MKEAQILKAYEFAKERYAAIGVDTDKAVETLEKTPISLHCWQTDDVIGFESAAGLSGGIQTTGNYPGRARNIDEVRADVKFAKSLIAGNHRLNLHEIYGDFGGKFVDRDEVTVDYFQSWIQWAKENNMKLDFNSTSFGHPKSGDLSLAVSRNLRRGSGRDPQGGPPGDEDLPGGEALRHRPRELYRGLPRLRGRLLRHPQADVHPGHRPL
jgi:L-rhamnose isomerase